MSACALCAESFVLQDAWYLGSYHSLMCPHLVEPCCRLLLAYLSWSSKLYLAGTSYSLVGNTPKSRCKGRPRLLEPAKKTSVIMPACSQAPANRIAVELYLTLALGHVQIWGVLVVVGLTGWWSIDSTRQGLALALVSAVVCPLAEIVLMNVGGLWHYPYADFMGIVSW
jgi:hypothetical protein